MRPVLFFAAAGALFGGGAGGGWYVWKRAQQEAAKQLHHADAEAARQALRDAIDLAGLRREAEQAGLDPDEVVAGYQQLRDQQLAPEQVLAALHRASVTK